MPSRKPSPTSVQGFRIVPRGLDRLCIGQLDESIFDGVFPHQTPSFGLWAPASRPLCRQQRSLLISMQSRHQAQPCTSCKYQHKMKKSTVVRSSFHSLLISPLTNPRVSTRVQLSSTSLPHFRSTEDRARQKAPQCKRPLYAAPTH